MKMLMELVLAKMVLLQCLVQAWTLTRVTMIGFMVVIDLAKGAAGLRMAGRSGGALLNWPCIVADPQCPARARTLKCSLATKHSVRIGRSD